MSTDANGTEDVMEGTLPASSPYLLAAQLGVTLTELARLAGMARATLVSKSAAGRVETALRPIVRILDVAAELAGDESRAAIWFKHQPLPGWGGKTAHDLVGDGRADAVLAYLEAIRAGVYA
jgi:uncharacterized protein (DUF2384 family)